MSEANFTLEQWLAYITSMHPQSIDLGLTRVKHVAKQLGLLNLRQCPVITVAGTNGKGSCVATLAKISQLAGLRTGVYTSPHFNKVNERFVINGKQVSNQDLCWAFEKVEQARKNVTLTYFEYLTLAALYLFAKAPLDLYILEVGLGGRLDAVNIIDPDLAIITSIGWDHQNFLGDTLAKIAVEKAGIIRPHKPVIFASIDHGDLLEPSALNQQATVFANNKHYSLIYHTDSWTLKSNCGLDIDDLKYPNFPTTNAAAAIMAMHILFPHMLNKSQIQQAIATVEIFGRSQVITQEPLTIVDVAHNQPAVAWLAENLKSRYHKINKWHAIFNCKKDKDFAAMFTAIAPIVTKWYIPQLSSMTDVIDLEILAHYLNEKKLLYTCHDNLKNAIREAQASTAEDEGIIAFGTFGLVAEIIGESC